MRVQAYTTGTDSAYLQNRAMSTYRGRATERGADRGIADLKHGPTLKPEAPGRTPTWLRPRPWASVAGAFPIHALSPTPSGGKILGCIKRTQFKVALFEVHLLRAPPFPGRDPDRAHRASCPHRTGVWVRPFPKKIHAVAGSVMDWNFVEVAQAHDVPGVTVLHALKPSSNPPPRHGITQERMDVQHGAKTARAMIRTGSCRIFAGQGLKRDRSSRTMAIHMRQPRNVTPPDRVTGECQLATQVNLLKLSVGSESVESLGRWQGSAAAKGRDGFPRHVTRMRPRRGGELLNGGSVYWVISGMISCRQRILRLDEVTGDDGINRCAIVLDPILVPVAAVPRRPFQGWRYLRPEDSPPDLPVGDAGSNALPPELNAALAEIGVL